MSSTMVTNSLQFKCCAIIKKRLSFRIIFKDVLCPHLKCHDNNDYTTLLSDMSPIGFDILNLSIVLNDILKECRKWMFQSSSLNFRH